jgi:hypothetical protein
MTEKIQAVFSEDGKFFVVGIVNYFFLEKLPQSFNNVKIRAVGWQKQQSDSLILFHK